MSAFPLLGRRPGGWLANGFFLGTLLVDIIADSLKRHYPYATDEISTVPEIRFAIKLCNMALEMVPHLSGSCRFQIINQPRYIQCRVNTDKKMDMILFTTEFFQSAISVLGVSISLYNGHESQFALVLLIALNGIGGRL